MEVEPHTGVIGKASVTCKHQLMAEIFKMVRVEEKNHRAL